MRIGIDARELFGNPTGAGRYLSELCTQWANHGHALDCQFILYSPPDILGSNQSSELKYLLQTSIFEHRVVPGNYDTWWEQFHLPSIANKDRLSVFFAPAYSIPIAIQGPVVLTIHDMSFAAHPEWFGWREGLRRRWLAERSAKRATLVITISEFSRQEIMYHLDLPINRVQVIKLGVRLHDYSRLSIKGFPPSNTMSSISDHEPLILFVGSIFNRRHLPDLINAFARVARVMPKARLTIVGENRSYPKQNLSALATVANVSGKVQILSYVTEQKLLKLYQLADVFVFLSEYEGFGFTPLEAMASGIPAIVTDTPVARELYGDVATFVPLGDLEKISSAILNILRDGQSRKSTQERALNLLNRYSWQRAAKETLAALKSAALSRP